MSEKDQLIEQMIEWKPAQNTQVTLKKLWDQRDAIKHEEINRVLRRTNYYELMGNFIHDKYESTIELRVSKSVKDDLADFEEEEIQAAVKNPFVFSSDVWNHVWQYDKMWPSSTFSYRKRRALASWYPFLSQGVWVGWFLMLIAVIVLCIVFPSPLLGILVAVVVVCAVVPLYVNKRFREAGYQESLYYVDYNVLNSLPVVEFVSSV